MEQWLCLKFKMIIFSIDVKFPLMRSCLCCLWLVLGHWYALWTHKHTCHGSYLQSEWRIRPGKQNRSTLTLSWELYFSYRTKYLDMKFYHVFLYPYRLNTFSLTRRGLWPAMSCSSRSAPLPVSLMGTSFFFIFTYPTFPLCILYLTSPVTFIKCRVCITVHLAFLSPCSSYH